MKVASAVCYALLAMVFLAVAWFLWQAGDLMSVILAPRLPLLSALLALALAVVGATSLVCGRPVAELSRRSILWSALPTALVMLLLLVQEGLLDLAHITYWVTALIEWGSFCAILAGLFMAPRCARS